MGEKKRARLFCGVEFKKEHKPPCFYGHGGILNKNIKRCRECGAEYGANYEECPSCDACAGINNHENKNKGE